MVIEVCTPGKPIERGVNAQDSQTDFLEIVLRLFARVSAFWSAPGGSAAATRMKQNAATRDNKNNKERAPWGFLNCKAGKGNKRRYRSRQLVPSLRSYIRSGAPARALL